MTGTVAAISSFFRTKHIKVPNEWVEACVDWLQEENQTSGVPLPLDKIKKLVFEQWLLADLTDLGVQCLPPQVATEEKYSLSGHFCLQVNRMIDISSSFYSQQTKLKGIDMTNTSVTYDEPKKASWQPPLTRMLKLELTDGMTTVHAMEYTTIPDLKPELKPGFKVLVQGTVLCRRGMLLLKRENVQVLGGEVDALIEANTTQKVIAKAMEDSGQYAGESRRREFSGADAAQFADRINHGSYDKKKKGHELPGTHNTKAGQGHSSQYGQEKSWNSKSSAQKTESWKPQLYNFDDTKVQNNNTAVDDFDDEWEADDMDYEFLDGVVMANSQGSTSQTFTATSTHSLDQTPQQAKNKKRSFSPYETNDSSILQKKKNSRLNSSPVPNEGLSQDFDDNVCTDNWDDDEMEMAMAMDVDVNPVSRSNAMAKKSSVPNKTVSKETYSALSSSASSASSTSSSRYGQLSGSSARPDSQPDRTMDTQLNSTSLTVNSSIDDIMKTWLELCKKTPSNPNAYSNLMKVEPQRLPYTYLFVLQGCQLPEDSCKFRIKGFVSTLLGKLERTNNQWKLMCMLNDGTGTLPVQLSDEVLTQLIGYSVQQSIEMTGAASDPNSKKKLQEGVKQCQLKIVNLCSIFEIETNKSFSHPLVTKITSLNAGHTQQLKRQVTTALAKV